MINNLIDDLDNFSVSESRACDVDYDAVYNSADPQFSMTYLIQQIQQAIQQNTTKHQLNELS